MTGNELAKARKTLGLSISETARALGVSARTICRWQSCTEVPEPIAKLVQLLLENHTFKR